MKGTQQLTVQQAKKKPRCDPQAAYLMQTPNSSGSHSISSSCSLSHSCSTHKTTPGCIPNNTSRCTTVQRKAHGLGKHPVSAESLSNIIVIPTCMPTLDPIRFVAMCPTTLLGETSLYSHPCEFKWCLLYFHTSGTLLGDVSGALLLLAPLQELLHILVLHTNSRAQVRKSRQRHRQCILNTYVSK